MLSLTRTSLVLSLSLFLTACGGGGISAPELPPAPPVATEEPEVVQETITVVGSLGLINGADVVVTQADGTAIEGATGTLTESGTIDISHDGSYDGPIKVTITGNDNATYFDESAGAMLPMPASISISAYAPSVLEEVGVTILTELAVQIADQVEGELTADAITSINNSVRETFAPELDNILTAPALVSEANFTSQELGNNAAGTYALRLAALANMAAGSESPALTILADLSADLADGDLDGRGVEGVLASLSYSASDFTNLFAAAMELAASTLAGTDLLDAVASLTVSVENNLLQAVVDAGVSLPEAVTDLIVDEVEVPETGSGTDGSDIEVEVPGASGDFDLAVTGEIITLGIGTEFSVQIEGIAAPSPNDTEAVAQIIEQTVAGVSNITNLVVTVVTNTAERVTFEVSLDAEQSGVSVSMNLTYDYTLSGASSGESSEEEPTGTDDDAIAALGQICFFGGEPEAVEVPEFLRAEAWQLTFTSAQPGAPYAEGDMHEFLFSSSGGLFIDNNQVAGTPVTCNGNPAEGFWKDPANNVIYAVSNLVSGFNEVNVMRGDDGGFLGQFVQN